VLGVVVGVAVQDLAAHRFTHGRVAFAAFRHGTDGDVPVGDHADEPVALPDRKDAGVDPFHDLCGVLDRIVRARDLNVSRHTFADLHCWSPLGWVGLPGAATCGRRAEQGRGNIRVYLANGWPPGMLRRPSQAGHGLAGGAMCGVVGCPASWPPQISSPSESWD